ncbi:MAG: hypothetical protein KH372_08435 [Olsenella uli]|nr:hypothetical protein [Olsenella uli]
MLIFTLLPLLLRRTGA